MTKIEISISKGIKVTPELKRRIQLAALPEIAENYALSICEKHFGKKFKLASKNQHGYDIISECGTIKVEVKQTSCLGTKSDLSIGATWKKKGYNTHIMIFDFYNQPSRVSIIPENKFYDSNFHGKTKKWRFNKNYNKNCQPINTNLFLEYEVKLN